MKYGAPEKARWWFAWRPVKTTDTERWVWLKTVYREKWYDASYFEKPDLTPTTYSKESK